MVGTPKGGKIESYNCHSCFSVVGIFRDRTLVGVPSLRVSSVRWIRTCRPDSSYFVANWEAILMNWLKHKMSDESGLLVVVLAIVGVVAILIWAAHRL